MARMPPYPTCTRLSFVVLRGLKLAWYLFLVDIWHVWMDFNPRFRLTYGAAREAYASRPWLLVFNCFWFIAGAHCIGIVLYESVALMAVALGMSEPRVWPVAFGKWRDAYTVRRFWG